MVAEALLEGEAEALTRKAIERALGGDPVALRLCLERILPARRDRPTPFDLPPLSDAADARDAFAAIVRATAEGELTPCEAVEISKLVEGFVRTLEVTELEARIAALESGRDVTGD
jgi:hypothetical protein